MNQDRRMQVLLEAVARALTRDAEGTSVRIAEGRRATRFEILASDEARGQLIGRQGATIRAIRTLASIVAHKQRRRFEVEVPGRDD